MNDPLKDFVAQHRAEFDHLDAPAFKLDQLRNKQQPLLEKKKTILLFSRTKWLAAATVLIALTTTLLVYSNKEADKNTVMAFQKEPIEKVLATPAPIETAPAFAPASMTTTVHTMANVQHATTAPTPTKDVYAGLSDSTSASTRLLAILEIEKSGNINNYLLDKLASTLNNDGNTNVRLAALSVMQNYRDDAHVSNLLVRSLNTQTDPMVQLGLVGLLGKMKNVKIEGRLQALANNPETFAAVRDEAYNILLNQDKL